MTVFALVGEGMIELSDGGAHGWRVGHGGDILNMAVHLARFGRRVQLFSALGDDPFSTELRDAWTKEGIDPALVLTATGATAGLYAVRTDADGERTFTYWRSASAARRMFQLPGTSAAIEAVERADVLVFSLISLAILPTADREQLIDLAGRMRRAGKTVVFDGNYRARLWSCADEAGSWRDRAIACCTIGLPTLDDEHGMGSVGDAAAIALHWYTLGAAEVVVKLGADGCCVDGAGIVPPPERLQPRDTSGAGDAFNAAYVHARCAGACITEAAAAGHRLAGWVVMRPGALPALDIASPYRD